MSSAMVIVILVSTRVWDPRPQIADWWEHFTQLSDPAPAWDARADGAIDVAAVLEGRAVVGTRGFLDAYRADTGQKQWEADVSWMLPAGDVIVIRPRAKNPDADPDRDRGYQIVSASSGSLIYPNRDAIAVWAFSDQIVDLDCPDGNACQLHGRAHDGTEKWHAALPAAARTITGADPTLVGLRNPAESFASASAGSPGPLPSLFGVMLNGHLELVDTGAGKDLPEQTAPDQQTRLALAGGYLLLSHAEPGGSGCQYWVEAHDPRTGATLWRTNGYDLGTASGAGCEQRHDPFGAGTYLVARGPDNAPHLLDVSNGKPVWSGAVGEQILATDGQLMVVQGGDRRSMRIVDLLTSDKHTVWNGQLGLGSKATVTRELVILTDPEKGVVTVLDHNGLAKLKEIKTQADVVGYGPGGLLLGSGRRMGYIPVGR
jgi:outer membrane protein assembly factor BamB